MEEIAGSEAGEVNRCQIRIEPCKEFEFIVLCGPRGLIIKVRVLQSDLHFRHMSLWLRGKG